MKLTPPVLAGSAREPSAMMKVSSFVGWLPSEVGVRASQVLEGAGVAVGDLMEKAKRKFMAAEAAVLRRANRCHSRRSAGSTGSEAVVAVGWEDREHDEAEEEKIHDGREQGMPLSMVVRSISMANRASRWWRGNAGAHRMRWLPGCGGGGGTVGDEAAGERSRCLILCTFSLS